MPSGIGRSQIDGVVTDRQGDRRQGARTIRDTRCSSRDGTGLEQLRRCQAHRARIREVGEGRRDSDLHRFDLSMHASGGIDVRRIRQLENRQCDLCCKTLTVRRDLVQGLRCDKSARQALPSRIDVQRDLRALSAPPSAAAAAAMACASSP